MDAIRNTPNIQGEIFFSSKNFIKNPNGCSDSLRTNYYREAAVVPIMEWLKN